MATNASPAGARRASTSPAPAPNPVARFRLSDGQIHSVAHPPSPSNEPSVFAVGVVKGGSSLLQRILYDLQPFSSRPVLPVHRHLFLKGVPFDNVLEDVDCLFDQPGYIFGTFRWLPQRLDIPAMRFRKKVLLVRDPRDMIVSAYYSFKESHPVPRQGQVKERIERNRRKLQRVTVDEYARTAADGVKQRYFAVMDLLSSTNILLRRYEDIVFSKTEFVRDIAGFYDIDIPEKEVAAIACKHDVFPKTENSGQHIRQVKPRNFETKLTAETIEEISHTFRAALAEFGYH